MPPYPLQTATYYWNPTHNQYENEWWLLCNSSTGRIYQQKEYLHTVQSFYSVKGQICFIPFHNDSYKSIISILKMVMLVQYKPNEIPVFPEELPLSMLTRNSMCPAENNITMQLLYVWHSYQLGGVLNKSA